MNYIINQHRYYIHIIKYIYITADYCKTIILNNNTLRDTIKSLINLVRGGNWYYIIITIKYETTIMGMYTVIIVWKHEKGFLFLL